VIIASTLIAAQDAELGNDVRIAGDSDKVA